MIVAWPTRVLVFVVDARWAVLGAANAHNNKRSVLPGLLGANPFVHGLSFLLFD